MKKYSVIVYSQGDDQLLSKCLEKICIAVHAKRTEIIVVANNTMGSIDLLRSATKYYCEKTSIVWKFIESDKSNIAHGWNIGVDAAEGEYFIFLMDYSLVTDNFIEKLIYCMDNFKSVYKVGKLGIVIPVSNCAVRRQQITMPADWDKTDLVDAQNRITTALTEKYRGKQPWLILGEFSAICIMIPRRVFEEIGTFNTQQLVNVSDAHDYPIRLQEAGYYTVAAGDVFVYRNVSTKEFHIWGVEKLYRGQNLYGSYKYGPGKKLAVLYRCKINDTYTRDMFVRSLEQVFTFTDYVFVMDDNSTVKLNLFLKEKHPELYKKLTKYQKFARSVDDARDRIEMLRWAEEYDMDWALFLEPDEMPEDKLTTELFEKLMNPPNPLVMGYQFQLYALWDGEQRVRFDEVFGQMCDVRMVKVIKGMEWHIPQTEWTPYQNKAPLLAPEWVCVTGLRIKIYGYVTPELRQQKREIYEKMGLNKKPGTGGDRYYKAFINDIQVSLYPWNENSIVSVYTPIKKGGFLVDDWLNHVWGFADEIVIGDDGMNSQDRDIATYWGAQLVPVTMKDDFSSGRNEILSKCIGDWIFQLDLDERFDQPGLLHRLMDMIGVDAWMFSIDNIQKNGEKIVTETARLFKNTDGVSYWGLLHETIDDFARKSHWQISRPPWKIQHYGYLLATEQEQFRKMQHYMEINMMQMEKYPEDPRAYYNLAIHLLEDNLTDDAVKLLEIAVALAESGRNALPNIELGKTFLIKAFGHLKTGLDVVGNHVLKHQLVDMLKTLGTIYPQQPGVSKGHALTYFYTYKDKSQFLADHCDKMQKRIDKMHRHKV